MGKFSRLGNDLYTGKKSVDFVGRTRLWYTLSGVIILVAVLGLYFRGLNMGIEFVGGAQYTVTVKGGSFDQCDADSVREAVAGTGIAGATTPSVTTSGANSLIIQTKQLSTADSRTVVNTILETTPPVPGADVRITLDLDFQMRIQEAFLRYEEKQAQAIRPPFPCEPSPFVMH